MGMSNFSYQKTEDYPDCVPGVWNCQIVNMKTGTTKTGAATIDFYIAPKDKEAGWNGVPFRKSVIDGDYFDRSWSLMCDCFGVPPEQAALAIRDFRPFVNKTGKIKFSFEKNEKQNVGYKPDGTAITEWVKVPTDYMQIQPLKSTTKLAVGPLPKTTAPLQQPQAKAQGFETSAPAPSDGGFPEDIPF